MAPPGRTLPFKHHKNDNQPQHHTETACEVIGGAPTTLTVKGQVKVKTLLWVKNVPVYLSMYLSINCCFSRLIIRDSGIISEFNTQSMCMRVNQKF